MELMESTAWNASSSGVFSGVDSKSLMKFQGNISEVPKQTKRKTFSDADDDETVVWVNYSFEWLIGLKKK